MKIKNRSVLLIFLFIFLLVIPLIKADIYPNTNDVPYIKYNSNNYNLITYYSNSSNFTETDPVYTTWDKSSGISILKNQVSDFPVITVNNTNVNLNDKDILNINILSVKTILPLSPLNILNKTEIFGNVTTTEWFLGLFNWSISSSFLTWTGSILGFNSAKLNATIQALSVSGGSGNTSAEMATQIRLYPTGNNTAQIADVIRLFKTGNTTSQIWASVDNQTFMFKSDKNFNTSAEIAQVCRSYPTGNTTAQLITFLNLNRTNGNVLYSKNITAKFYKGSLNYSSFPMSSCSGTDKVIGIQKTGAVSCGTDQTGGGGGRTFAELEKNVRTSHITIYNQTVLTLSLSANTNYTWGCSLWSNASATTVGTQFNVTFPVSPRLNVIHFETPTTNIAPLYTNCYNKKECVAIPTASLLIPARNIIDGRIWNVNANSITIRLKAEALGKVWVMKGSYCWTSIEA